MIFDEFARNEKAVSGIAAVLMHVLFFALLFFGVSWQKHEPDSAMVVDLWSSLAPPAPPKAVAPPTPKPEPEPEPPPKPEPKPAPKPVPKPPPPPPKPEVKPTVKPDIALKEKLEKERKQKELEAAEKARKQKEAEALKQKEREKAEAKKRAEEKEKAAQVKAQQQKELAEKRAAAEVAAQQKAAATQAAAASQRMIDEYKRRIRDKIRRNIVEPPNLDPKAAVEFDIVVLPGGEVLSAKLKRSSNSSPAYDSAVERAILKAQPLPLPPDPALMKDFRELNLVIRPKE